MELISKEEFDGWKSQTVTKAFYAACKERINDAVEVLANEAGLNATQDNFLRGMVYAYREVLSFHVVDEDEVDSEEGED